MIFVLVKHKMKFMFSSVWEVVFFLSYFVGFFFGLSVLIFILVFEGRSSLNREVGGSGRGVENMRRTLYKKKVLRRI